ncbi:hypothetical protein LP419_04145 [Massilia sp. H-1]|nr:hypothetical protein LP419_04145 [Massilia sp. H-1]
MASSDLPVGIDVEVQQRDALDLVAARFDRPVGRGARGRRSEQLGGKRVGQHAVGARLLERRHRPEDEA